MSMPEEKGNSDHIWRMGVLGTSSIAPLSVIAASKGNYGIKVIGVAGSSYERTTRYAEKYGIARAYSDCDSLLADDDIDCVYIPLPNALHGEWMLRSLHAGKHVLVEKPAVMCRSELSDVFRVCDRTTLKVLEGIMVMHHPWQNFVYEFISRQAFGKLRSVNTVMNFMIDERARSGYRACRGLGGGAFMDQGPYWIQFIQRITDIDELTITDCSFSAGPDGCDWTTTVSATDGNDVRFCFTASFESDYAASHMLRFERGTLEVPDFLRAYLGRRAVRVVIRDEVGGMETVEFPPCNYFENQLAAFAGMLNGGAAPDDHAGMMQRAGLMERIRGKLINAEAVIR